MAEFCDCCKSSLGDSTGVSQLFNPGGDIILCEDCWLAEDALVEVEGTNAPEFSAAVRRRLELYKQNGAYVTSI